jgi:hypothetical protein
MAYNSAVWLTVYDREFFLIAAFPCGGEGWQVGGWEELRVRPGSVLTRSVALPKAYLFSWASVSHSAKWRIKEESHDRKISCYFLFCFW